MILTLLLPSLEKIINLALKSDPDALAKIGELENQLIKIDCTDWNMVFYIVPDNNGLQFHKKYSGEVNTEIKGTLNNFLHIFIKGADTKTLFQYPIDISGNTHNIEVLRNTFKNLDLDLEEKLSHFVGDSIAHKLFFHIKETKKTLENSSDKLFEQLKEYIHFEAKNLVSKKQAEKFYADVAKLRDDVDRLEARL
ncbi:MAG: SCP2 sterol-binding domain-containing protein [Gammaproteobacteria bacterium]|nr:SCP2 sterol-binding domain-containing protein [Gammaproteobacteria bacterium]